MMSLPNNADPVRVGLVGLGGHGRTIRDATAATGRLRVAAVFDPDGAEAASAAEQFGCPAAASYEALVARGDLEAVVLCTPNHVHRAQAEAALAAGLHVFVEKPIANTVADGRAMLEAAEAAGRVLAVGHNMRFSRSAQTARAWIAEGRVGVPVTMEIHFSSDAARHSPPGAWRLRADQCPLLPVMQLGIHALDLVPFLLAPVAEVSAWARSVTTAPGVVDSVVAAFRTADGPTGTMVSNYCTGVRFEYRVAGTEASLVCTPHSAMFEPIGGPPEAHDFAHLGHESYALQMADFGAAVRAGATETSSAASALRALAVVEAMAESAASGRPVAVPSVHQPVPADAV